MSLVISVNFTVGTPLISTIWYAAPPLESGIWTFTYAADLSLVTFKCSACQSSVAAESIKIATRLTNVSGYEKTTDTGLREAQFPPRTERSFSCPCHLPNFGGTYGGTATLTVQLSKQPTTGAARRDPAPKANQLASRSTSLLHSYSPNDVVFYFPRSKRELWASSTILMTASPYFKTMFDSGFAESKSSPVDDLITPTVGACITPAPGLIEELAQDSDDETDRLPYKLAATRSRTGLPHGVREIIIKSATYTTYHATLSFIHSGSIAFAPLSSPSLVTKNSSPARTSAITTAASADPTLPLPVSPKSVYKLAHLLELTDLEKLALDDFKSKLTVGIVLHELVTDMAAYDAAREALVAFAVANWGTVRQTAVAEELKKAEVIDGLPNASAAVAGLFDLATKADKLAG